MKYSLFSKTFFCLCVICTALFFTACQSSSTQWDTSERGNSDANLQNLGLAASYNNTLYYIGTESPYDLIYETDKTGHPLKAITGLTGYIQYLNAAESGFYFLGITYDNEKNRSEAIFSTDINGKNQNCIYTIAEGFTTTYLAAIGDLLIYAAEDEQGKTEVRAINPEESSEALLFSEKNSVRSLQIINGKFCYITKNKVYCRDLDGKNKTTIYESEGWIGSMVSKDTALYFVKDNTDNDTICKIDLNGEDFEELCTEGNYISHMSIDETALYFTDDHRDDEGNLKKADICKMDLETNAITTIGTVEEDYISIDLCNDLLICHMNDEHLTAKVYETR